MRCSSQKFEFLTSISHDEHPLLITKELKKCGTVYKNTTKLNSQLLLLNQKLFNLRIKQLLIQKQQLRIRFRILRIKEGESVSKHLNIIMLTLSELKGAGDAPQDRDVIAAIFNSLPESYRSEIAVLSAQKELTV